MSLYICVTLCTRPFPLSFLPPIARSPCPSLLPYSSPSLSLYPLLFLSPRPSLFTSPFLRLPLSILLLIYLLVSLLLPVLLCLLLSLFLSPTWWRLPFFSSLFPPSFVLFSLSLPPIPSPPPLSPCSASSIISSDHSLSFELCTPLLCTGHWPLSCAIHACSLEKIIPSCCPFVRLYKLGTSVTFSAR